jgi:hypothetical protein
VRDIKAANKTVENTTNSRYLRAEVTNPEFFIWHIKKRERTFEMNSGRLLKNKFPYILTKRKERYR